MTSASPPGLNSMSTSDETSESTHIDYTISDAFKAVKCYDVEVIKIFIRQKFSAIKKEHMKLWDTNPAVGEDTVKKELSTVLDSRDERWATMLHWACYNGSLDIVKILISFGANPNQTEIDGKTPLHWAAFEGYYEICKYLLNKAPNINPFVEEESNLTPCHLAVMGKHDDVAKLFSNYDDVMANSMLLINPIEILVDTPRNVDSLEPYQETEDSKTVDHENRHEKQREGRICRRREKEKERQALMNQLVFALLARKSVENDHLSEIEMKWRNDGARMKKEERLRLRELNEQKKVESAYLIRKKAMSSFGKPPWIPPPRNYIETDIRDLQHPPLASPSRYHSDQKENQTFFVVCRQGITPLELSTSFETNGFVKK
eukprot:Tbor_TRINITY_DN5210_c0_g2::TRINITY_DN5210_c0_g2_i1::g.16210::m.16210